MTMDFKRLVIQQVLFVNKSIKKLNFFPYIITIAKLYNETSLFAYYT